MSRPRSLLARVEAMHAVATCLESFTYYGNLQGKANPNIASAVVGLMADELELLITEVNDDHIMPRPAAPERRKVIAAKVTRKRKAVRS